VALIIDIVSELTSKPSTKNKLFICHYPVLPQRVATTPVPALQMFHAPQFENPKSSPETHKTVVMKLHHRVEFA